MFIQHKGVSPTVDPIILANIIGAKSAINISKASSRLANIIVEKSAINVSKSTGY